MVACRHLSKRMKQVRTLVATQHATALLDVLEILKKASVVRFQESLDICVALQGIDVKKGVFSGTVQLPCGLGRQKRVAILANPSEHEILLSAGADCVGFQDLVTSIKEGVIQFDVLLTTPDMMKWLLPLGTVLGPKGLMPNPKLGTLSQDLLLALKNIKAGQAFFKADKFGILQCKIGSLQQSVDFLSRNFIAFLKGMIQEKPSYCTKSVFIKRVRLSTTMGPSIALSDAIWHTALSST
jgi:large subunit ribosomal protein L1